MSCIVPNTPPLTGYGPRAHCALNSIFILHSQLLISELLAISLRTAQPLLATQRRRVTRFMTRPRTSPRTLSTPRQFLVSQTRFVHSSLNSSSLHSSCFSLPAAQVSNRAACRHVTRLFARRRTYSRTFDTSRRLLCSQSSCLHTPCPTSLN